MLKLLNLVEELDFNTMKRILNFILLIGTFTSVFSQQESSTFQTDIFYGKPIEHDKKLNNAIQGNSFGILLSWNKKPTETDEFNTLYNFPERGYSAIYQDFNSTVLGEVFGAYRHFTYNLTPKSNNPLKLTTAFGIGYATKKYDEFTNNQNIAIGSNLLVSAYLKLQYYQLLLNDKLSVNTGISLLHFSNVGIKSPNLGINTVSLNLGVNYVLNEAKNTVLPSEKAEQINEPIQLNLVLRGGYNESLIENSGLFPFYTVSIYGSKKLNKYSTITGGLDYFDAKFLKKHIEYINASEGKNYDPNNYKRAGVFIGHELTQNRFAFVSQLGYTFYSHYPYISKIYERFGFKHTLNKHLFSEISLKANLFRAESLEFGIGYKF